MQSYSLVSLTLMIVTGVIGAYAYSPSVAAAPLTAVLMDAKPISADINGLSDDSIPAIIAERSQPAAQARERVTVLPTPQPDLPNEFAQLQPRSELAANTEISSIIFASNINDNYEPVAVRSTFGEGNFTVYGTFDYAAMQDGMTWSWVWRHNGEVVGGGEQVWDYGEDGPGWVYFAPEEGFTAGEYSLEVWVNGELQSASSMAIEAGVANQ